MEINKEITLDANDCAELERAHFEYNAVKDNIAYLIDTHSTDVNYIESQQFRSYQEKQFELFKKYTDLKNEITLKYIPTEYLMRGDIYWDIDFKNKLLVIKSED